MVEKTWFKCILYVILTLGCLFSGLVIYYAAKNGMLSSGLMENLQVKAIIVVVPFVLCLIIDYIYHYDEMIESFGWSTAIGAPLTCLFIGYSTIGIMGDKTIIDLYLFKMPVSVIYILMYAIPLVITYLVGLLSIWTGEAPKRYVKTSTPNYHTQLPSTRNNDSDCSAGGIPSGTNPNSIPHYPPYSE